MKNYQVPSFILYIRHTFVEEAELRNLKENCLKEHVLIHQRYLSNSEGNKMFNLEKQTKNTESV
jgi:hypothetical protein